MWWEPGFYAELSSAVDLHKSHASLFFVPSKRWAAIGRPHLTFPFMPVVVVAPAPFLERISVIRSVRQLLSIRAEFADIVRNEKDKPGIDTSFREPDKAGRPPKKEKQQEDVRASQGTYPEQTAATQSNLRVAIRLGQLALASLSKPFPATSYTASILKSHNMQVEVGQMHHNDKALNAFCRAGWQVLRETRKVDFQSHPPNIARLNLPRCWAGSNSAWL